MCIICASWKKNELKLYEAWKNYAEMKKDLGEHAKEVDDMLTEALNIIIEQAAKGTP